MQARATVLGYIQRGGIAHPARPHPRAPLRPRGGRPRRTTANWGQMAALHGDDVVSVPLTEATAELKLVPDSWYETAKTFFG